MMMLSAPTVLRIPAQGNALGYPSLSNEALKGRHICCLIAAASLAWLAKRPHLGTTNICLLVTKLQCGNASAGATLLPWGVSAECAKQSFAGKCKRSPASENL